jgi:photosystem II stability/assembly factor-like uncharacterized protein
MAAVVGCGGGSNSVQQNPVPTISSLSPASATAGASAQALTIQGTNFVSTSVATYNNVLHGVTFLSATQLQGQLTTADLATAGSFPVVVTNPAPGGGPSNPLNFSVSNPVPTISNLSPASATAGAAAQSLTINGTNFVSTSAVTYNSVVHAVTLVSATELQIQLSTSDLAIAGSFAVVVTNPSPGGGPSSAVNFPVSDPSPTISNLSPASANTGVAGQVVAINGTNFVTNSAATYNNIVHTVTFVSSTQLQIQLTAADLATAGSFAVVVTNPAPGGGVSNSENFSVNDAVPTISGLSPASANAGAPAQTLTVNGMNFVSGSAVTYNNVVHAAAFVSATQLQIQLTTADLATAGSFPVAVTNPSPGGGLSNSVNFAVTVPGSGSLTVNVTGLPSGEMGNVTVTGPDSFSQRLTETTTLTSLPSGIYTVSAAIEASSSAANQVFMPTVSGSPAVVNGNANTVASATYASLSTVWQPVGPQAISGAFGGTLASAGKLNALAVNQANPSEMYVAGGQQGGGPTSEAGIYKTVDGGQTWTQSDVGLTDPVVNALWLDQNNPSTVLAGTTFTGIFQSTDAGASWSLVAHLGPTYAFLQTNGTLYAATASGLAQSSNDGATWTIGTNTQPGASLAASGQTIYEGLLTGGVLVQTSPSGPWTSTSFSGVDSASSIAVNPTNPQNALVSDFSSYQTIPDIYVTSTGGNPWTAANLSNCAVQAVGPDWAGGTFYAGCDFVLLQSVDNGVDWSVIDTINVDVRSFTPGTTGSPGNFFMGSDQGLYVTTDGGTTWHSLNGNITSSLLYSLAVNGSTILTVAQDFGSLFSYDGGSTWQWNGVGNENGVVSFNPGNTQYAYLSTEVGVYLSTDGGHTFAGVLGPSDSPAAVDPEVPSTVYVPLQDAVYKSLDWGATWTAQSWTVTSVQSMTVDPSDSKTLFVTANAGGTGLPVVMVTHDGGSTWATASLGSACGFPITVTVDPANRMTVYAAMIGNGSCGGGILKSVDGGATFAPSSAGLNATQDGCSEPDVTWVRFDPSGSGIMAAATSCGPYLSSDLGSNWMSIRGNAVPNTFSDLTWSGGNLYTATFGEGVLRMSFPF